VPGPSDEENWMHKIHASNQAIALLVMYGLLMLGAMVWLILTEFPAIIVLQDESGQSTIGARGNFEIALLKLVLSFGAIGGLLHLLTSLGRFVGGRKLERSWVLFYLLRPPVGAVLGLLVYLILRMSALGQQTTNGIPAVNVFGVLAFSGLAGMFSRQAVEKLAEAFDVFFQKTKQEIEDRPAGVSRDSAGKDGGKGEDQRPRRPYVSPGRCRVKRVSMSATISVQSAQEVSLSIVVGDAQIGSSYVQLDGVKKDDGQISDLALGKGADVKGKTLAIKSVVTDVNDATNNTSITYHVGGQELSQTATVDQEGDSVVYRATIQFA
jgi:hypothetical protein